MRSLGILGRECGHPRIQSYSLRFHIRGEQSRSFYPFMGGESRGCDQRKPIPHELRVTSDEVVRANFAFGTCQQEAIRGHDDLCDRRLAEASVEYEPHNCCHCSRKSPPRETRGKRMSGVGKKERETQKNAKEKRVSAEGIESA